MSFVDSGAGGCERMQSATIMIDVGMLRRAGEEAVVNGGVE